MNQLIHKLGRHLVNLPGWRTNRKIVVIESDDWGSIRMPSIEVYEKLLKAGYPVHLNPFEKYDSLASQEDLELLFELLLSYRDINGNHPVVTANCVVANPDFDGIKNENFHNYHYELIDETFKKYPFHENNLELWKKGDEYGVFHPQFHAREHLNVSKFMSALQTGDPDLLLGFDNKMPGNLVKGNVKSGNYYVEATNYENESDKWNKLDIYLEGLNIFEEIFGFKSLSIIPPNYTWSHNFNQALVGKKVKFIQGLRKMREPHTNKDLYFHRFQGAKNKLGQIDLVRNVSFEPSINPCSTQVEKTLFQMAVAFRMHKPVIISSHRINYVGYLHPENRDNNLKMLKEMLGRAIAQWPDIEFFSSDELGLIIERNENRHP